jgi:glycosyltransferase involved in cell wall biosynthesis
MEFHVSHPLVSVIIPTYNRKGFLIEAITSVLDGSFCDYEVIVVDDGSTDGTAEAISELEDPIRYHYQSNRGVSNARNTGVQLSGGKYIAFLDSDDLWQNMKLEFQVDFLANNPEFRICHSDEIWIRNGTRINQKDRHRKFSGDIFEKCLPLCIISPSSILMERSVFDDLGGFDETLPVCEDYDLWLRMTLRYVVGFVRDPLVIKRGGHPDQLSKAYWGMDRFRIRSLAGLVLRGDVNGTRREAVLEELRGKCKIVANGARRRGKEEEAKRYESLPGRLTDLDKTFTTDTLPIELFLIES